MNGHLIFPPWLSCMKMIERGIDMNSDFLHTGYKLASRTAEEETKICLKFNHQSGIPASYTEPFRKSLLPNGWPIGIRCGMVVLKMRGIFLRSIKGFCYCTSRISTVATVHEQTWLHSCALKSLLNLTRVLQSEGAASIKSTHSKI